MLEIEEIPDKDEITRLIFEPHMRSQDGDVFWNKMFQFQSGSPESVVWREHATLVFAHNKGCRMERERRQLGRDVRYSGAMTTTAGAIRAINVEEHHFEVLHHPQEGIEHAHVQYAAAPSKPTKNIKNALKLKLFDCFGPLDEHRCNG
ncbi:MAG: hypothetical protein AAF735_07760 [Myxococcota bacterium]